MVKDHTLVPGRFRVAPAEGAKDDWIFETFTLVDSNDPHSLFVAFESLLVLFRCTLFAEVFSR